MINLVQARNSRVPHRLKPKTKALCIFIAVTVVWTFTIPSPTLQETISPFSPGWSSWTLAGRPVTLSWKIIKFQHFNQHLENIYSFPMFFKHRWVYDSITLLPNLQVSTTYYSEWREAWTICELHFVIFFANLSHLYDQRTTGYSFSIQFSLWVFQLNSYR